MVAFVLADAFLEKFGGDSIDEIAGTTTRPRLAALALAAARTSGP
jgi:hypothetical protein